jgi:hypothetical protein
MKTNMQPEELVQRMFDLDMTELVPNIRCPFTTKHGWCEGVPHMSATVFGREVPCESTSGPGLIIQFACEYGHEWQLRLADHSGGIWLEVR